MQKISTLIDLLLVEFGYESEVYLCAGPGPCRLLRAPPLIMQSPPGAELGARRTPYEDDGLLLGNERAGRLTTFGILKVPWDAVLIIHREVQGQARNQLQTRE